MTSKKREYTLHRENCQEKVRKSHTTKNGSVISLLGKHGFEWSVTVEKNDGDRIVKITTYPDRVTAVKHYNQMCKA